MLRTFQQHRVRPVVSLDGMWDFTIDGPARKGALPRRYDRKLHVPSAWETTPGLEAYRGNAWARTRFDAMPGRAARLVFGGVSHTGDVFIDGRKRGHHYDAFTPWDVVTPGLDTPGGASGATSGGGGGGHELVVAIDNTFGGHSALHLPNDYYTYGGLTRPVELQHLPEAYVDRVFATPRPAKRGWDLDLRVRLANWGRRPIKRAVTVTIGGVVHDLGSATVPPRGQREIKRTLTALDVEPWSHESPRLYELAVELYDGAEAVDDLIDRVGFRQVEVKGKKLLLNGEPIRLRGYNRHEDHPNFGCAIPLEAMVQDLNIIRDLGCNFVRTCHYPNDMRFLDLCDELGIYVWEESHARTVNFDHPRFREQIADSTREMIDWHHNHPSILLWGCLNECESETRPGRAEHARVISLIRKLDPSRPVTYASNRVERDLAFGLADIASVNLYTGWYGSDLPGVEARLNRFLKWLHSDKSRGGRGKPVIVSEFGGGAIPGYTNPAEVHWSEEYLTKLLDSELAVYLNHPDVVGAAVWQFADCRVTPDQWHSRPRTMNNKGTVDQFRRPKQCYAAVKKRMLEAKRKWDR